MASSKRPPIEVADISQNLRDSKGQGMNAFFSSPHPTPAPAVTKQGSALVPRHPGTTVLRNHGTTVPKREIKRRHPFDVYRDQLRTLKEFSMQEKLDGLPGSESAMVREAIDAFIEKRRKK
jgi:hypothetical protein